MPFYQPSSRLDLLFHSPGAGSQGERQGNWDTGTSRNSVRACVYVRGAEGVTGVRGMSSNIRFLSTNLQCFSVANGSTFLKLSQT